MPRIRVPLIIGTTTLIVFVAFMTSNLRTLIDSANVAPFLSDVRTGLAVTMVMMGIWIAVRMILEAVRTSMNEGAERVQLTMVEAYGRLALRLQAVEDEPPTQPLPRPRLVGTAVVEAAAPVRPDELPGYAFGYADGRAGRPDAKVIPIDGHRN